MKNIILLFFFTVVISSCLKDVDDVELNTNPFDQNYAYPIVQVEKIGVTDNTSGGDPRCGVFVEFQIDETTLERVKKLTNINDENVKVIVRYRIISTSISQPSPKNLGGVDLDLIELGKTYTVYSPSWVQLCEKEIILEALYEDVKTGGPGGTAEQKSEKEGAIQELDRFVVTL